MFGNAVPGVQVLAERNQPPSRMTVLAHNHHHQTPGSLDQSRNVLPSFQPPLYDPRVFNIQFGPQRSENDASQQASLVQPTGLDIGLRNDTAARVRQSSSTRPPEFGSYLQFAEDVPIQNSTSINYRPLVCSQPQIPSSRLNNQATNSSLDNLRGPSRPSSTQFFSRPTHTTVFSESTENNSHHSVQRRSRLPPAQAHFPRGLSHSPSAQVDTLASVGDYHATLRAFGSISVKINIL